MKSPPVQYGNPSSNKLPFFTRWNYKILGPTAIHLQHEFSLVVTLAFFTTASLLSLYRTSFGLPGDFTYLSITTLWISRHFIYRFVVTTDVGTSLDRSVWDLRTHLSNWLIWLTSGGQYFDKPIKHQPLHHHTLSADNFGDGMDVATGGGNSNMMLLLTPGSAMSLPFHRRSKVFQYIFLKPIIFIWAVMKWMKSKLSSRSHMDDDDEFGLMAPPSPRNKRHHSSGNDRHSHGDHSSSSKSNRHHHQHQPQVYDIPDDQFDHIQMQVERDVYRQLDILESSFPPAQLCVAVVTLIIIFCFGYYAFKMLSSQQWWKNQSFLRPFGGNKPYRMYSSNGGGPGPGNSGIDGYASRYPNHFSQSTGRPMVKEAIEEHFDTELMDRKFQSLQASRSNLSAIAKHLFYGPLGMLAMVSVWGTFLSLLFFGRILLPIPDLANRSGLMAGKSGNKLLKTMKGGKPWSETYKPISSNESDRFQLYFTVAILRVIENVILCVILPQTEYACKATGHCYKDTALLELNSVPGMIGATSRSMYDNLMKDYVSIIIVCLSVTLVTTLILLAQAVALDKSFLALKGYMHFDATNGPRTSSTNSVKKGGKKHSSGNDNKDDSMLKCFYNVSSHIHQMGASMFVNELGALSSSRILAVCSHVHVMFSLFLIVVWILYSLCGKNCYALVLTFIAVFNSAGAMEIGLVEFDELESIAKEIFVKIE